MPRPSAEKVSAERFPHGGGQAQALRVDPLVVAVEHERVFGVRNSPGAQPEAVGGDALPAKVARVGGATGEPGNDLAAWDQRLGHAAGGVDERGGYRGARAVLAAGSLDLDLRREIAH